LSAADDANMHRDVAREQQRAVWRLNVRWIAALLSVWFVVTFVVSWYARELRFDFFGWPFSFWAGAQGVLILYVIMAMLYAWRMNRADDETEAAHADDRDAA
jgi:putative solute:sodium symporter small subunit